MRMHRQPPRFRDAVHQRTDAIRPPSLWESPAGSESSRSLASSIRMANQPSIRGVTWRESRLAARHHRSLIAEISHSAGLLMRVLHVFHQRTQREMYGLGKRGESDRPDRRCWQAARGPPAGHPQAIGMPSTSRMHAIGGPSATRGAAIASTPQSLKCRRSSNFTAKMRPLRPHEGQLRPSQTKLRPFPARRGAIAPFPDENAPRSGPRRGNCALSRRNVPPSDPTRSNCALS